MQDQEQEIQENKVLNQNQNQQKRKNENFRIAKEWRVLNIKFTTYVQQIVAFEKTGPTDPSYKIMIYFNNGIYQIWDIQSDENPVQLSDGERKISETAKFITPISRSEIIFLDTESHKIKILDIDTHTYSTFQPEVPTIMGIPTADRTQEKLENLITDGVQFLYLDKPQLLVVLEQKQQYSNSPQNVITCWKIDRTSDGSKMEWQSTFDENEQRDISLVSMNDDKGTIIIYGSSYQDAPIKFRKHQCTVKPTDESLKEIVTQIPQSCQIIASFPGSDKEILFWANTNNGGVPIQITVDIEENIMKEQEYIIKQTREDGMEQEDFEDDEEEEDDKCYLLNEVAYYNKDDQIVIIGRTTSKEDVLDIYNPLTNQVSYTVEINNEIGIINRSYSLDKKYFIEYEQNTNGDEDDNESMEIQLSINTIVRIRTSVCYFMEQSGVMDIYVPKKQQEGKNLIQEEDNQQKPDLQNEEFLEQVIQALTTGIKFN